MTLETRDIMAYEVFSTGTWNGDEYTEDDLDAMVQAATALPMSRPVKVGHLKDGKLIPITADFAPPAVGWVENLRRVGDKLVGDLMKMPRIVAELVQAGAYRKRSAEVYWNYPGEDGKVWPRVFKALAILGADMPAVTNLADVAALYDDSGHEFHVYEKENEFAATPLQVFASANIVDYLVAHMHQQFTDEADSMAKDGRVSQDERKALSSAIGEALTAFNMSIDQMFPDLRYRPRYEDNLYGQEEPTPEGGDPMKERVYALLGLADDVPEEDALTKLTEIKTLSEKEPEPAPDLTMFVALDSPEYKVLVEKAAEGDQTKTKLYELERKIVLDKALADGCIWPVDLQKWTARYDRDPSLATEVLAEAGTKVDFTEHGTGGGGGETHVVDPENRDEIAKEAEKYQESHEGISYRDAVKAVMKSQEV